MLTESGCGPVFKVCNCSCFFLERCTGRRWLVQGDFIKAEQHSLFDSFKFGQEEESSPLLCSNAGVIRLFISQNLVFGCF